MQNIVLQSKKKLIDLAKKKRINYLALFGSYARGEESLSSDIDMLVDFDSSVRVSLFDLMKTEDELTQLLGRKVDLVTKGGVSKFVRPYIMDDIKIIYAQES